MARFKVVGVKRWAGPLDDGNVDSCKLFVEVRLDDSRNGEDGKVSQYAAGLCTEEIRLPKGAMLKPLEGLVLPVYVELDTERVSNGKTAREVVTALRVEKLKVAA